ncbi:MAG: hypothetical protein ACJATW_002461 [Glaciecola sp.]|jgi:hypothetical protein
MPEPFQIIKRSVKIKSGSFMDQCVSGFEICHSLTVANKNNAALRRQGI